MNSRESLKKVNCSWSHLENSSLDQLLDFWGKSWVSKDLSDFLRVILHSLQGTLDFRGSENILDLRVRHGGSGSLFLVFLRPWSTVDGCLSFLDSLLALDAIWIHLQSLFVEIKSLVILFHDEVAFCFFRISFNVVGIKLETLFEVLESIREAHQLGVAYSSVKVVLSSLRVSLDSLFVFFDGDGELAWLECLLSSFVGLFSKFRIDVALLVLNFFEFFRLFCTPPRRSWLCFRSKIYCTTQHSWRGRPSCSR